MSKVKVAVRVRPMNKRELDMNARVVVDMVDNQTILDSLTDRKGKRTFAFDHCFWTMDRNSPKYSDQVKVFDSLGRDILENSFEGYNACIFAYGQTGSGKSYTMMGAPNDETQKGIIPRLCDSLFERIAQNDDGRLTRKVEVSYMEIYCERVRDLLCGSKLSLKVREHQSLGPYVEGLSKLAVTSFSDIDNLMCEGNKSRTVAATQMNAESSRSHAVFSITLTQTLFDPATQTGSEKVSKISLVDLAGSERAGKTGALGDRLKEGSQINKSLTTLGLVISSLADQSAGKRSKTSYIPYRDSTLTWLLKDNLGGNSKTVMVATVSPASDNYEETLSTLRYADRAKRIVNHAVINEDPNAKIVRELREEVEKLKQLLGEHGLDSEGAAAGSLNRAKEIAALREKLAISQHLMDDMSKTWEERLTETERIHKARQKALEDMGISVQASGIGVQSDKFYLVNLNADPSMNELLVCYLKESTRIGRPNPDCPPDIQLQGLGIQVDHCLVELTQSGEVFITAKRGARTLVNGRAISERSPLKHGHRVLLGNNHLFRLSCPGGGGQVSEEDNGPMDYDSAMKEVLMHTDESQGVYAKMLKSMQEKHREEKEGALEEQRRKYEQQLAELKSQLVEDRTVSSPALSEKLQSYQAEEEGEEMLYINQERLLDSFVRTNSLVSEANMLSEELHRDMFFRVTLQIPAKFLTPHKENVNNNISDEIMARVFHKYKCTNIVWSLDTLEEKVVAMRELYQMREEGGGLDDTLTNTLVEMEQHSLLGVANLFLECLHQDVRHQYDCPIIAPTGNVIGRLRMAIQKVQFVDELDVDGDGDQPLRSGSSVAVTDLRPGSRHTFMVEIQQVSGLPSSLAHYAFCQYRFFGQSAAQIVPQVVSPLEASLSLQQLALSSPQFQHTQRFEVDINEEFLEWMESGSLAVEVWGHHKGGETPPEDEKRSKTFTERWNDITKRLVLWVEIMELNDQGQYVPVTLREMEDNKTGGIYQLKQGQSRRIHAQVEMKGGGGPLQCDQITSIAIGSIFRRYKNEEPLDSFQDSDLDRLRNKWSLALSNRKEFLDSEVKKIIDKKDKSQADTERQEELIDQWTVLQWERSAVLNPRPGNGVPGAPTKWDNDPGVEEKVPTLFLDLNDDLLTPNDDDPVGAVSTGVLLGEKEEKMIDLKILKQERQQCPLAVASWDSSAHDNTSLNITTGNNERVYIILKVGIRLKHPPGIVLYLRKRICLRIQKKPSGFASLMRKFSSKDTRTRSGVMYEVVTGIPKLEGMQRPKTKGAEHSYMEIEEDENVVDKYSKAMESIASILQLDKLKQEVALKEKLTLSGKTLRKKYHFAGGNSPMNTPTTLSRAGSGNLATLQASPLTEDEENVSTQDKSTESLASERGNISEQIPNVPPGAILSEAETGENHELSNNDREQLSSPTITITPVEGDQIGEEPVQGDQIEEEPVLVDQNEKEPVQSDQIVKEPVLCDQNEKEPVQSDQSEKDPVQDDQIVKEPVQGDQIVKEPVQGDQIVKEPVQGHQIVEDPVQGDQNKKDPVQGDQNEKEPVQGDQIVKDPVQGDQIVEDPVQGDQDEKEAVQGDQNEKEPVLGDQNEKEPVQGDQNEKEPVQGDQNEKEPAQGDQNEKEPVQEALLIEVGEKVMVEVANGFKIGTVKFVGETKFQPGVWVGVALERPNGKHNGEVQGIKYFKCKEKHGVFVRPEKIVRDPSNSPKPSPKMDQSTKRGPVSSRPRRSASGPVGRPSTEMRKFSSGVTKTFGKKF